MWPRRWSRVSSRLLGGGSSSSTTTTTNTITTDPAVAPTASALTPSISFKSIRSDLGSIVDDGSGDNESATGCEAAPAKISSRRAAVFHRVRIATAALRTWKSISAASVAEEEEEEKRIVVYYTSLRIVRKSFEECRAALSILRGFRVAVDERDLSMDSGFLNELKQLLGKKKQQHLSLPRVFIGRRYVGGFEEISQMHESGELRRIVEGVPEAAAGVCDCCGGMRFVLCQKCSGSHKYYSEKSGGFRTCSGCNEIGLVRCPDCFVAD